MFVYDYVFGCISVMFIFLSAAGPICDRSQHATEVHVHPQTIPTIDCTIYGRSVCGITHWFTHGHYEAADLAFLGTAISIDR